eukprot:511739-Pelagomonas_calceolata.AAC.4
MQAAVRQAEGLLATVVELAQKRPHKHRAIHPATTTSRQSSGGRQSLERQPQKQQLRPSQPGFAHATKHSHAIGKESSDLMRKTALRVLAVLGGIFWSHGTSVWCPGQACKKAVQEPAALYQNSQEPHPQSSNGCEQAARSQNTAVGFLGCNKEGISSYGLHPDSCMHLYAAVTFCEKHFVCSRLILPLP